MKSKKMKKSKDIYEKRKKNFEKLLKRQKQTINFISALRFIVFTAGFTFMGYTYIRKAYYLSVIIFVMYMTGFIYLAIRHNKVIKNRKLTECICDINDSSIKRTLGEWKQFRDNGEEFTDGEHCYSDDLDLFGQNSLFQWINVAQTELGRTTLKECLTFPILEKDFIYKKQEAVKELTKGIGFRQRLQAEGNLNFYENKENIELLKWASEVYECVESRFFKASIYFLPILTIASVVYYFINFGKTYAIPLLFIMLNMGYLKLKKGIISKSLDTVYIYKNKIRAYANMIKMIESRNFKTELLKKFKDQLNVNYKESASEIINNLSKIADKVSDRNNVFSIIFNFLYLRDFHLVLMLNSWKKNYGVNIETWLKVIGNFEALSSLSIINYDNPEWTLPKIDEHNMIIYGNKVAHPLLFNNAIANDIRLGVGNSVLLITGSNMSGKSTYLRTIGVNLVLAYAGAPVRAEGFTCSLMNVYTCMRIGDNLEKSISSFYAEIIRIKSIVSAANTGRPVFFLLDEIFKGTNSLDRHLGAETLINELSEKNTLGIVSTHDLELGSLEKTNKKLKNYNFQEHYVSDAISFDYKLREGVSKTRNAIYLMKLAGIKF